MVSSFDKDDDSSSSKDVVTGIGSWTACGGEGGGVRIMMAGAGRAAQVLDMFPMELKNTSLTDLLFLRKIVPVSGTILGC